MGIAVAQSAGAVEYTDHSLMSVLDMTKNYLMVRFQ